MQLLRRVRTSIQAKLLLAFSIMIVLLTLVIGIATYLLVSRSAQAEVNHSFQLLLDNVSDNIKQEVTRIQNLSDFLFMSDTIKQAVDRNGYDALESWTNSNNAYDEIQRYVFSNCRGSVNSVSVLGFNGFNMAFEVNYIGAGNEWAVNLEDVRQRAAEANGNSVWSGARQRPLYPFNKNSVMIKDISLVRVLKNERYREDIGVIHISVNPQVFLQHLGISENRRADGCDYHLYLIDKAGGIIAGTDDGMDAAALAHITETNRHNGESGCYIREINSIAFASPVGQTGWTLIGTAPYPSMFQQSREAYFLLALCLLLSALVCLVAYFYLSRGIFSRIQGFCEAVQEIGLSRGDQRLKARYPDEIGRLAVSVNQMLDQIDSLNQQNMEKELKIRDAVYHARQSQMNPHFILNTLNSIRWMAQSKGAADIVEVVNSFWNISKYASGISGYFVEVREEVKVCREYVRLQEYSYPGRFRFFWNVDREALGCRCIKFFLQPIVENAIIHGIFPLKNPGEIYVNIYIEEGMLNFNIHDNGVGMEPALVRDILAESSVSDPHIGLRNVFARLRGIYGSDRISISIDSSPGSHTDILIRLPCAPAEEVHG